MAFSPPPDLNMNKNDCMIRVRVSRISESINHRCNGELNILTIILTDEDENMPPAVTLKDQVNPLLQSLIAVTSMEKLQEAIFILPEIIDYILNNGAMLSDVIGCFRAMMEMENGGSTWRKVDIPAITDICSKSDSPSWEECGENLNPHLYSDLEAYTIIVSPSSLKKCRGYLRKRFTDNLHQLQTPRNSNSNHVPKKDDILIERMTVEELLVFQFTFDLRSLISHPTVQLKAATVIKAHLDLITVQNLENTIFIRQYFRDLYAGIERARIQYLRRRQRLPRLYAALERARLTVLDMMLDI